MGNRLRRSIAAKSRRSFPHRDFANPQAETCWLSSLFQSLWHSVVFHSVFEQYLASPKYTPEPDECILAALQQTWVEYKASEEPRITPEGETTSLGGVESAKAEEKHLELDRPVELSSTLAELTDGLVPPDDLVEAFGTGYGDMSEAFALVQSELEQSPSIVAMALAGMMTLVPVMTSEDGGLPTPDLAWKQVEEWGMQGAPLLAADLNATLAGAKGSSDLAALWVPQLGAPKVDFGSEHRLVALVCYMPNLQHYTAFIRRQREPLRCLFFNDLPELTNGAKREVEWKDVPAMCGQFGLNPRLALYESNSASEKAVHDMSSLLGGLVD